MIFTVFDLFASPPSLNWRNAVIEDERVSIRFGDLAMHVRARAGSLRAAGIGAKDRVLISCPNSVEWIVSTLAVMRLGAIATPINPGATDREIALYERIVEPSGVILAGDDDADRFHVPELAVSRTVEDVSDRSLGPLPSGQDRALILFTSGTTGIPKAAVQLHSVLIDSGLGVVHWLNLTEADRILLCMPMFHANAIYYSLMGGLCAGVGISVRERFSVSRFWETVRNSRTTQVNLMGPMVSMLLKSPPQSGDRNHSLRLVYTAACKPELAAAFMERFGAEVIEGYGMTETPYGCINPLAYPRRGSVGLPRQHPSGKFRNEIRVLGPDGVPLKAGETGDIMIRNEATFSEYWGDASATQEAFSDGWLRTGDLGYKDDAGYVYIVGRAKEIVRRNGVNISPAEVELVARDITDLEDAALIGLPNLLGEEIAVLAVTISGKVPAEGIEERVLSRLRTVLSREKMPDLVVIVDDIPRTSTLRIQRGKLRECLRESGVVSQTAARR